MPLLLRGDPPAYRHPPYQGGQGGSNLKSIFNLIITSYLSVISYQLPVISYQLSDLSFKFTDYCLLFTDH
ncbi:hypothetical protein EZJ55_21420 [Microcystis aeruginosa EAWAG127a]|uniref:Uncharacterized protein n=1 Tax=Microcystis aeruginosa EAWAG127a TaxID=2529855 RepID=A0A5J5M078_MICAE|nr:hypothetical protein EZJ55_21420 [Microcystis aeruginosa EAWAG127a]